MEHAIIRNGVVENIIVWDGKTPWTPPEGTEIVKLKSEERVVIGGRRVAGKFLEPVSSEKDNL